MAAIEGEALLGAPVVELEEADVPAAAALSEEAGWNQTAEDWALMIRLGRAFGIRLDGQLVATGLALPYPPAFGWISMVLVHGPCRRRGLATRLVERAIAALRERGLVPLLDATPAGREVYGQMGFRPVEALTRWRGTGAGATPAAVASIRSDDLHRLSGLDREAFGADRSVVLADLLRRPDAPSRLDPSGDGYLLSRPGRTATHLGPLVARDEEVAVRLLEAGLAAVDGAVLIDVPDRESGLARVLADRGFRPERPFTRMALGRDTGFGEPSLVRAVAGPELG